MNVGGVGRKFEYPIGLTVDAHRTCLVFPLKLNSGKNVRDIEQDTALQGAACSVTHFTRAPPPGIA